MHGWDYLVFVPVAGAVAYLWQRSRKKNTSCGACSSCPAGGCGSDAKRKTSMGPP